MNDLTAGGNFLHLLQIVAGFPKSSWLFLADQFRDYPTNPIRRNCVVHLGKADDGHGQRGTTNLSSLPFSLLCSADEYERGSIRLDRRKSNTRRRGYSTEIEGSVFAPALTEIAFFPARRFTASHIGCDGGDDDKPQDA